MRAETWFLTEKLHGVAFNLYTAIVFEGEYLDYFKILEQYINTIKMDSFQILKTPTSRMFAYHTTNFDDVQRIANVIKIFVEMTFTVLQEKLNENN